MLPVISTVLLKLKDFARSQGVMYCKRGNLWNGAR